MGSSRIKLESKEEYICRLVLEKFRAKVKAERLQINLKHVLKLLKD